MNLMRRLWAVVALVCIAVVVLLANRLPLQTNLLALLPATERNPVAEQAVARLADTTSDQAVFLIEHSDPRIAKSAARHFANRLRDSKAFSAVLDVFPLPDPSTLVSYYRPYRFGLLAVSDRETLETGQMDVFQRLTRKLYRPFPIGPSASLADDPFGLFDDWLASLPLRSTRLEPDDGLLVSRNGNGVHVLVTAKLDGSAFDSKVQRRTLTAVEASETDTARRFTGVSLLRTGAVFYAAAARETAEKETDRIGLGSLAGIGILMLLMFRSPRPLLLAVLSVAVGLSVAIATVIGLHGELHLITLVFGASLIGEAVDYAIQFFAARAAAGPAWNPDAGLKKLLPGLGVALATSALCYGVLLLAPLPAIRQIALFALAGLTAAFATVVLWLPGMSQRPARQAQTPLFSMLGRALTAFRERLTPGLGLAAVLILLVITAPGWFYLRLDDDIRLLMHRPADLLAQEEIIRKSIGAVQENQFFLVEGKTQQQLLENEEKLTTRLRRMVTKGELAGWQAVSDFVPSQKHQAENLEAIRRHVSPDPRVTKKLLEDNGLTAETARKWLDELANAQEKKLTPDAWLLSPLSMPSRHLWLGNTGHSYAAVVAPSGFTDTAPLAAAMAGLPEVTFVDKAGSVSDLFAGLRRLGIGWLVVASALVWLVLSRRYGARPGLVTLAPTLVGMLIAPPVSALLGVPFSLFSVMALMLVLGIGVNYTIFLREGGDGNGAALAGVLASAATTLLSFGLLAFSSVSALHRFGTTLAIGIGAAVLLSPIALVKKRGPACA